jgi:hypothetical protein
MFDFIIFGIFIFSFIFLLINNVKLRIKTSTLALQLLEEKVNKNIIIDKAKEELEKEKNIRDSEGFLKFVSDSRDWAFQYIEDVQNGIGNFVNNVEPEISYFDNFQSLSEGHPLHDSMKIISNSYKDLKKLLPEDYGKIE